MKNTTTFFFALILAVLMMSVNVQAQGIDFEDPVKVFKSLTVINIARQGDITGDGIKDLVIGGYDTMFVLKGNGDGTFTDYWKAKMGSYYDLKIVDVTNDGKMDIVFPYNSYDLGLLVNNGSGGFQTLKTYHIGGDSDEIGVADFDKDGYLDVVAPTSHDLDPHYRYISVFINNKNGTFKNRVQYSVPPIAYDTPQPVSGYHVNVLDMNDDGYTDVVQPYESKDSTLIYYNKGNGTFDPPVRLHIPTRVTKTQVRDLDHDGKDDLILIGQKDPTVINPDYLFGFYLQKSGGADQNIIRTYPNPKTGQLYGRNVIEDINQDGEYDVTLTPQCCLNETDFSWTDSLVIYLNQGNLNFNITNPSYRTKISGGIGSIISDDFNGDNLPDYCYVTGDSSVYMMFQKSTVTGIIQASHVDQPFLLYPNPCANILNVYLSANLDNTERILVYDSMGQELLQQRINDDRKDIPIDLSSLRNGMFFLKVEYQNGISSTQYFIHE